MKYLLTKTKRSKRRMVNLKYMDAKKSPTTFLVAISNENYALIQIGSFPPNFGVNIKPFLSTFLS